MTCSSAARAAAGAVRSTRCQNASNPSDASVAATGSCGGVEQRSHARLQRDERRVGHVGAREHVQAAQGRARIAQRSREQVRHEVGCLELADRAGLPRLPARIADAVAPCGDHDGLSARRVGARPLGARVEQRAGREAGLFGELARSGDEGALARVDQAAGQFHDRRGGAYAELLEHEHGAGGRERHDGDGVALFEHVPVRLRTVGQPVGVAPHPGVAVEHRGAAQQLPVRNPIRGHVSIVARCTGRSGAADLRPQSPRILRIFSTRAPMSRSRPRPVGS